jgi:hypothetical protein
MQPVPTEEDMERKLALATGLALLVSSAARAECCRVVKVDSETPDSTVRVCEVGPDRSCGALLYTGTLSLGASQNVCAEGSTIVYQELDPALGTYRDPVEAQCNGADVEL